MNSLINGVAADYLTVNDRAIHYGDGLFETILCHDNQLYYWPQHYQRLRLSAEKIKLDCPDEEWLLDDITKLLRANDDGQAYAIKIIVTRGTSRFRGYSFDKKAVTNRLTFISSIENSYSSILSQKLLSGDLFICEQQVSINENLAGLKHLNRLDNLLAKNERNDNADNKMMDGLMLNANQHVIEATTSNVFAVKNNQLYTPQLSQSGVQGIMRDAIIDIAKDNNIDVFVSNIGVDDIGSMDELFISNSLIGMKAVNHLNDKKFIDNKITKLIFDELLKTKENYVQVIK